MTDKRKANAPTEPPLTDAQEAEIQAMIASDPDDREWTEDDFAKARPFAEACPELAESILRERPDLAETMKRARGRPRVASPRQQVSIRLDPDVLAKLKATGPGWQTRINDILRKAVG
jgi:uncharacterized protein (DUF4415 family)